MKKLSAHHDFIEKLKSKQPYIYDKINIVGKYHNKRTKIIVGTKYGECAVLPPNLLKGAIPTIATALNKTKYFINQAKEVHGDNYDYSQVTYIKNKEKIKIICLIHGEFEQTPNSHLNGRGCSLCSKDNIKSIELFINQAKETHGNRYSYDKTEYFGSAEKIKIICPIHGEFEQRACNHLDGKGCPRCANDGMVGIYNTTLAERNKEEWKNIKSIVYVVYCSNTSEGFYKIGITTNNVKSRFQYKRDLPYEYKIIKEIKTNLYDAIYKEKELHEINSKFNYIPEIYFGGYTECFSDFTLS